MVSVEEIEYCLKMHQILDMMGDILGFSDALFMIFELFMSFTLKHCSCSHLSKAFTKLTIYARIKQENKTRLILLG